ncbi:MULTISPECIES: ABC transporter substrate-binding protein [Calothrix]|uniref:ABC transporter substrate-binding protein n=2 Tax=Calothrix TaxID=1186 RepID=A0ABR8AGH8_9CYAN|nr:MULTISPECIES: ABC transporter substrate-binding protein [Calothrix]MBD2199033.1 ABC transporter substrate-binding protein [Calothrix parietina FACHB-288]MBD2227714.1 ABC transporter substrate-binding protein [Calothrix anomala FACHB-343]
MNVKKIPLTSGVAATLLSIVSGTLVSCTNVSPNSDTATNTDTTNTKNVTDTSTQTNQSDRNRKLRSVGVTLGDLSNPFFVVMAKGAEKEAQKIGGNDVKVTVVSSGYDLNQQFNQIENFVAANTDLIVLNAADSKGIRPAVEQARKAGTIVIAVDTPVEAEVDATVTTNNVQAGEISCQYIADRLKGKGNVVIVNGPPVTSVIQRVDGCLKVLAKYPNIKLLSKDQNAEGSRDGGLRVMSDLLVTFPKIDAVFAINDPSGVGVDLAANQAKRRDFFIVGVDGAPEALEAIATKDSLYAATATQNPRGMTVKAVQVGNDILNGKKPASPNILIPAKLITKENVSKSTGW